MPDIDAKIRERLKSISERTLSVLGSSGPAEQADCAPRAAQAQRLPWTKEAEFLKERDASIDFQKTIDEMFLIIKNMETQLTHVLDINSLLEEDLNHSKERIVELKARQGQLLETIAGLEEQMPSKRELQMVIDQLLEERNEAELKIRDLRRKGEQTDETFRELSDRIAELGSERADLSAEINFLETRLGAVADASASAARQYEERIATLEGQLLDAREKSKTLEHELRLAQDQNIELSKALQGARKA
ncbi:MAG: hypothetical protein HQK81_12440 [Desulfovibrionaceae bacterium]|nr:hypothetical protein [Desulfovibrionaceae bacterium]MBF0514852.1 hypothetical protein [Desulfovibrionaceae bacterium]